MRGVGPERRLRAHRTQCAGARRGALEASAGMTRHCAVQPHPGWRGPRSDRLVRRSGLAVVVGGAGAGVLRARRLVAELFEVCGVLRRGTVLATGIDRHDIWLGEHASTNQVDGSGFVDEAGRIGPKASTLPIGKALPAITGKQRDDFLADALDPCIQVETHAGR